MLIILSPSKTIDFKKESRQERTTVPSFLPEAKELTGRLSAFTLQEILDQEKLSPKLAELTYEYIHTFPMSLSRKKQAIFAYTGHVYDKLNASTLDDMAMDYLNSHLRIFSALYGVLKPSDEIQAYRLDMNSRLIPDLYAYWKEKVTSVVAEELKQHHNVLVNLASAEYFKMLDLNVFSPSVRIITPVFQQEKNGRFVTGSMYAKQARGAMLRFMAMHQIEEPEYLKAFTDEGYCFDAGMSTEDTWCFIR